MESKIDLSILEIFVVISYFTFIIMVIIYLVRGTFLLHINTGYVLVLFMRKARDVKSWYNIIMKMK